MADNVSTSAGIFATDDIGGAHYERVKLVLGADGVNDGDVHSSNALPVDLKNISSVATQATLAQVTTFTQSTNTLLVNLSSNTASSVSLASSQLLRLNSISTFTNSTNTLLSGALASSGALWVQSIPGSAQSTISATDVIKVALFDNNDTQVTAFGGGTQYVDGNTTTNPTGTVMLWKSAVSTIIPVSSSNGLPVNVVAGSLNANTEYTEGNTTTAPTGIVMLWKSAVSTLRAASTSDPLPVSTLPVTANIGTVSSLATEASLASTVSLNSSQLLRLNTISTSISGISTNTQNISTFTNSTNTLLVQISSNTASSNALVSTQGVTLGNISTFTNSTNTLLVQVSSLLKSISTELAPVPIGIYTQPVGVSSNGLTPYKTLNCNNSTQQIVSTAATIYGIYFGNTSSVPAYLKIWDGVSSATFVSSTAATMCLPIPANSTNLLAGNFTPGLGIKMSTGICIAGVLGANDGNSTAIGISTLIVNVFYKS